MLRLFTALVGAFQFLFKIWDKLPTSLKEEIVEAVVSQFESVFRKYYRKAKGRRNNE